MFGQIEFRGRQDSNIRGKTPLDFESNALTTRPRPLFKRQYSISIFILFTKNNLFSRGICQFPIKFIIICIPSGIGNSGTPIFTPRGEGPVQPRLMGNGLRFGCFFLVSIFWRIFPPLRFIKIFCSYSLEVDVKNEINSLNHESFSKSKSKKWKLYLR